MKNNGIYEKIALPEGCSTNKNLILKKLQISIDNDDKDFLIEFIDTTKNFCEHEIKNRFKTDKISKTIGAIIGEKIIGIYYLSPKGRLKHFI